jgi:hypothetical protein
VKAVNFSVGGKAKLGCWQGVQMGSLRSFQTGPWQGSLMCPFQNSYMGCCKIAERFQTSFAGQISSELRPTKNRADASHQRYLWEFIHHIHEFIIIFHRIVLLSFSCLFACLPSIFQVSHVSTSALFTSFYPLLMAKRHSASLDKTATKHTEYSRSNTTNLSNLIIFFSQYLVFGR